MKPFAFFIGCNIPSRVSQYEMAARAVLKRLQVELKDFPLFNCCGYPMRNTDENAFLLSASKNLALAEKEGLDILTLCKCCFGSLKAADFRLKENSALCEEVNEGLASHGLKYEGKTSIKHLLTVLYHDVGIDRLKQAISKSYKDLSVAVHYGCHALRPSRITEFDDPVAPRLFDDLVELTGAKSVEWEKRLECCGAPLTGSNDSLSMDLARKKLEDGRSAGADYLCVACPWCQMQFDSVQDSMFSGSGNEPILASILYPQLLGLSMGVDKETLGIGMNRIDIGGVESYLKEG